MNYRYRRTKISRGRVRPRAISASRFIRCRYVRNVIVVAWLSREEIRWKNERNRSRRKRSQGNATLNLRCIGGASFRCVRCAAGIMMETGRSVVRVLNGAANTRIGIGSYAVMSRTLIAAVSTRSSVTGVLSEDLDVVRRSHQTYSLQNRRLVRSQKLRATLRNRKANVYLIGIRFTNVDSR